MENKFRFREAALFAGLAVSGCANKGDTGEEMCSFEASGTDTETFAVVGTTLGNELSVTRNPYSPEGDRTPDSRVDVLTVDFTAVHPNCANLEIQMHAVGAELQRDSETGSDQSWSDAGWIPTWEGASIDGELIDSETPHADENSYVAYSYFDASFIIPAGETVTVNYSANVEHANSGDAVKFFIEEDAIWVSDGSRDLILNNHRVYGFDIAF